MSSRTLKISTALALPPEAITASQVVYGGKGMGKTNYAAVVCEEVAHAGFRFSLIDPMGVTWGLRHDIGGKGPGIEVLILGGIHGDIPIEPTGGAIVADLVVDNTCSVILDISRRPDGSMWSIGERVRFVRDYCKQIYRRNGEKRRPFLQVIDEAARFAPQTIRAGDAEVAACSGAVAVLVEEGRNVGIGVLLVTQRSARLSKDVAELADCMIAFRTVGPNSMAAVLLWLGEHVEKGRHKELAEKLRGLPVGSALVVSPGWLKYEGVVAMRARKTFDSSATPKPGQHEVKASGPGAKPDLAKYQALMAETIERATAEDPRTLKAEIAKLRKELAAKPAAIAAPVRVEVPTPALTKADMENLAAIARRIDSACTVVLEASGKLDTAVGQARGVAASLRYVLNPVPPERMAQTAARENFRVHGDNPMQGNTTTRVGVVTSNVGRPAPRLLAGTQGGAPSRAAADDCGTCTPLGAAERKILTILVQYPEGRTKVQVALLAGYAHDGGGFNNALGRLRTLGFIAGASEKLQVTQDGDRAAGDVEPLPFGRELQTYWMGKVGKAERLALGALVEAFPQALTKEAIAEKAGYAVDGGGFNNALGRLRSLELIEGKGELRASATLFEGA